MIKKKKNAQNREYRQQFTVFSEIFESRGIELRREKLSRGPSFRVKSGNCLFTGKKLLFVDDRLPNDQQLSVLVDYVISNKIALNMDELSNFPKKTQSLLGSHPAEISA